MLAFLGTGRDFIVLPAYLKNFSKQNISKRRSNEKLVKAMCQIYS